MVDGFVEGNLVFVDIFESSVLTSAKATAPFRKCMAVVAGTPSIEVPNACVVRTLLPRVTRTITARNWYVDIVLRTMDAMAGTGEFGVVDTEAVETSEGTNDRTDASAHVVRTVRRKRAGHLA